MIEEPSDPAPRAYPPMVSLLRRGSIDALPPPLPAGELETWLLTEAVEENDLLELFQAFVWHLVSAGIPLDRASLHVGTLHPELYGYAWNWNRDDGLCDEVKVDEAVLAMDEYKLNPLYRVIEFGEQFRSSPESGKQSPLLADLAQQGITEYAAVPLRAGGAYHNAATVATRHEGGFSEQDFATIERLLRLLALHVERHIAHRISENVLTTYLGAAAGTQVLQGSIKRGSGAPIAAIIWFSDLRGFTKLADRISGQDMLAVLNEYFDRLAGAIMAERGEILKFIGDGVLAVFPFSQFEGEEDAAASALLAAQNSLKALAQLNADHDKLPEVAEWRPLETGISLHRGEIFFGNVGAPKRLDFTVMGRAVNTASRVEGLCKELGRSVLVTEPVADLLSTPLEALGPHSLRGVHEPLLLFSPPGGAEPNS